MRLFVLLAVLALAGCGEQISAGTVVEKKHESERHYVVSIPLKTSEVCTTFRSGTSTFRSCTPIYIWIPYHFTDDEDWILVLEDGDKRGGAYVSKDRWDAVEVGEWWERDQGEQISDPNERGGRA